MDTMLQAQVNDCKKRNAWDEAIVLLESAQRKRPQDVYLLGELAFSYSRAKQYDNAIKVYEELCNVQPEVARWPYGLGYQYYAQQQYVEAVPYFDRALELNPDYIAVLYRKGYALSQLGDQKRGQALTTFEKCRRTFNNLPDGEQKDRECKHYANACFQQGKLFLVAGNFRLAEERLQEAVSLRTEDPDVLYNLGKVYLQLNRFTEAIDSLKAARRLSPKPQHYILDYLGRAYLGASKLEEARSLYESMPSYIQKRAYILRNMGEVYIQLEKWERAENVLRRALKQEYRNHNGHFRLGFVLQQMGRYEEAASEFKKADDLRRKHYDRSFPEAEVALEALLSAHPEIHLNDEQSTVPTSKSGRPVACVKVYFDDKGYGFLERRDQGEDLFFHISDLPGHETVSQGECFAYDLETSEKGLRAINLEPLS
jgi:superkiller protein 3